MNLSRPIRNIPDRLEALEKHYAPEETAGLTQWEKSRLASEQLDRKLTAELGKAMGFSTPEETIAYLKEREEHVRVHGTGRTPEEDAQAMREIKEAICGRGA